MEILWIVILGAVGWFVWSASQGSAALDDDFEPDEVHESWGKSPEVDSDRVVAEFEYAYGKSGTARRTVDVEEVMWGGGRKYYLYGHCREVGGRRVFKASGIRGKVSFEGKEYTPTAFMKHAFDIDNRYS